jgi:leucyl aminopeptidase (aminopeptidase T)
MEFDKNLLLLLDIKPWEKVLILTDKKMERIANLIFSAIKNQARVEFYTMPTRKRNGEEPTLAALERILSSDVVIAVTKFSITHTKAVKRAVEKGIRVATMPNISKHTLLEGAMTADYSEVQRITSKLFELVKNSKEVVVTAKNGTNIRFSCENRVWHKDDGNLSKKGSLGNLPAGEVFVAPIENSVNGAIIFDRFPLTKTKLFCEVLNGKVVSMRNDINHLERIFKSLGDKARQVAEFGIGTNSKARVIGNILEDEKALGTCHFGLGNNLYFGGTNDVPFHSDGIINKPTVKIDGKVVMKNGKLLID